MMDENNIADEVKNAQLRASKYARKIPNWDMKRKVKKKILLQMKAKGICDRKSTVKEYVANLSVGAVEIEKRANINPRILHEHLKELTRWGYFIRDEVKYCVYPYRPKDYTKSFRMVKDIHKLHPNEIYWIGDIGIFGTNYIPPKVDMTKLKQLICSYYHSVMKLWVKGAKKGNGGIMVLRCHSLSLLIHQAIFFGK